MRVSYNRNAGVTLDADLALLVIDVGVSVKTWSCSDSRLKWDAWFLRPASEVEHQVAKTRAWNRRRSYSDSVGWDAELLRLALNASLLRPASEVSILLGTRGPHFSSGREVLVSVQNALKWGSRQMTCPSDFWTVYKDIVDSSNYLACCSCRLVLWSPASSGNFRISSYMYADRDLFRTSFSDLKLLHSWRFFSIF